MKHLLTIALCTMLAAVGHAAGNGQAELRTALAADSAYRVGNYAEAIAAYEQVLADGYSSADLHYNLGNAYYRDGQTGRAILNYERALRLKPSMRDARENLALAEARTADRITRLPRLFVVRWVEGLTVGVSPSAWRLATLAMLLILAAAVVLFRLGGTRKVRKWALVSIAVATVLAVACLALAIGSTSRHNSRRDAIIIDDAVAVKGSPEWQSNDKLLLHEGTKVAIVEELTGWYKIRIADGTTGWLEQNTVERI